MKPVDAIPHGQHTAKLTRAEWVDLQLIHTFMRYARPALHAASVLIVVVVGILYRNVDSLSLGLWALAATIITLLRYWVTTVYRRDYRHVNGPALKAFMRRYGWTWPLSSVIWGSLMFVFFMKAPLYDQFLCMMVLIGMAAFAVGTFSSHLRSFSSYVNGLGGSILLALGLGLVFDRGQTASLNIYGMVALLLIYWAVILVSGFRFHEVQRANIELQFDNGQLIASLTEKGRAALEAIDIKNRFIASAAHDLRQPVHALGLYADWLSAEPEFAAEIAPKIVRSTQAVNDMFDSLFDMAGLASDAVTVNWQTVDLPTLIQDLEVQYAPLALARGLSLRTRARLSAQVHSDPTLLKRLIGNLLSNAFRNTQKGGVLLALRRRRSKLCIEVWDSGVGIAEQHQKAIFQEFYRVPAQGTEEGFGLGLAIVSRLSERLGHPVTLASRPGRGTVFRLELKPVGKPSPASTGF